MAYYQILKQRRKDLNLSIHDVSSQTRLAPQYIAAIEENDLEVFLGDFDFVRRFVKAYCEVIGVNWDFIKDDVELNISQYVHAKSQAPSQPVVLKPEPDMYEVEEQTTFKQAPVKEVKAPTKKKKSTKKKKASSKKKAKSKSNGNIKKGAKKVANWTRYSRQGFLVAVVVGVLALLFAVNMVLNKIDSEQNAAEETARQAELKAKEEETAKLANQKQETKKKTAQEEAEKNKKESVVKSESVITCTDKENNIYTISNLIETDQRLTFELTLPEDTTVAIYQDDTPINDTESVYTKDFSETFTVDHTCLIQLEITNYLDNEIIVNGQKIKFDTSLWYEGEPAILYFEVKTNDVEETNTDEDADVEDTEEVVEQDNEYTDEYEEEEQVEE